MALVGDILRKLLGTIDYNFNDDVEKTIAGLKTKIIDSTLLMQEVSCNGGHEYCIHVHIAYTQRNLDVIKRVVEILNRDKYVGLTYRVAINQNIFTVWARW